jgi:tRNA pseudouridine38-40 synthase
MTKRYKIIVAYDGTAYHGWQVQKELPTVAGTLQNSFRDVFQKEISILGASRTDVGVHALGQVATFSSDLVIEPQGLLHAWSNKLSPDIVIRSLEEAPADFNPHHNVHYKTYWYHFFLTRPLPVVQRYGWFYKYPLDLKKLDVVLQTFVGTHDFRSFCTGDEMGDDTVRTIDSITLSYQEQFDAYRIQVRGERFLHHMIRRIVGASLDVAARNVLSLEYLPEVLAEKDPEQNLTNAPGQGLMLAEIVYKNAC